MKSLQAMAVSLLALGFSAASMAVDFRAGVVAGVMEIEGGRGGERIFPCPIEGVIERYCGAGVGYSGIDTNLYAPGLALSLTFPRIGFEYTILADARRLDGSSNDATLFYNVTRFTQEVSLMPPMVGNAEIEYTDAISLLTIEPKWSANVLMSIGYDVGGATPYIAAGLSVIEVDAAEDFSSDFMSTLSTFSPDPPTLISQMSVPPPPGISRDDFGVEVDGKTLYGFKFAAGAHFDFGRHRVSAELGYTDYEDGDLIHDYTTKGLSLRYLFKF